MTVIADFGPVSDTHLAPIRRLCGGEVTYREDGSFRLIHMQNLRFYAEGVQKEMNALLCLNYTNPSYPTKLFLAEKLSCGLNWNETAYLLGAQWHTFSWSNVANDQPPIEILAAHLAPLSKGQAA